MLRAFCLDRLSFCWGRIYLLTESPHSYKQLCSHCFCYGNSFGLPICVCFEAGLVVQRENVVLHDLVVIDHKCEAEAGAVVLAILVVVDLVPMHSNRLWHIH
jgi:hypothetical protein